MNRSVQFRHQSKLDESENAHFQLPSVMPVKLDSYRFLSGGETEERYVLWSDVYTLNDDESRNEF